MTQHRELTQDTGRLSSRCERAGERSDSAGALREAHVPGREPGHTIALTTVEHIGRLGSLEVTQDREQEHVGPRDAVADNVLAVDHVRLCVQILDSLLEQDERVNNRSDAVVKGHLDVAVASTVVAEREEGQQVVVANGLLQAFNHNSGKLEDLNTLKHDRGVRRIRHRRKLRDESLVRRDAASRDKELVNVVNDRERLEQGDAVAALRINRVGALVRILRT